MKKTLIACALLALVPAGMALADDDGCSVPRADWQPREAVETLAKQQGWTLREIDVDDGCYELEAFDKDGRRIEVEINPATLAILEIEYEDGYADTAQRNPAPAGAVAPPQNGLFGNGAPPTVKVD